MTTTTIPGYTKGSSALPASPLTEEDLRLLEKTLLLTEEDKEALRKARAILEPQVEAILDTWYGFVGDNPHLLAAFCDPATGAPDQDYLAAVRRRFGQWILDTCDARHDREWLDWQDEIGRRHHRTGKNRTDGARAAEHVPFRYLMALVVPIYLTIRPFLEKGGAPADEVERMHQAWLKSVLLQAILWSRPYVREGDF